MVAAAGVALPAHSAVDTSVSPTTAGAAAGMGVYTNNTTTTVTAAPNAGFKFVNWTENGDVVSTAASFTFTNLINQSLVANFVPVPTLALAMPQPNTLVLTWPTNFTGFVLQQNADPSTTNWSNATNAVSTVGSNQSATVSPLSGSRFFRLAHP